MLFFLILFKNELNGFKKKVEDEINIPKNDANLKNGKKENELQKETKIDIKGIEINGGKIEGDIKIPK